MDITQETFLEAFSHLDSFDINKAFSPWLCRIVHNRSLNYITRRKHRSAPSLKGNDILEQTVSGEDDQNKAGTRLDRKQLAEHLKSEVSQLPDKLKGAFVLRYMENKSLAEVASILSAPVNTVKTHLFRARDHLRKKLRWWFNE